MPFKTFEFSSESIQEGSKQVAANTTAAVDIGCVRSLNSQQGVCSSEAIKFLLRVTVAFEYMEKRVIIIKVKIVEFKD